jgi:hypothetical protein
MAGILTPYTDYIPYLESNIPKVNLGEFEFVNSVCLHRFRDVRLLSIVTRDTQKTTYLVKAYVLATQHSVTEISNMMHVIHVASH